MLPHSGPSRIKAISLFSIETAVWSWLLSPLGLPEDRKTPSLVADNTNPLWQLADNLSYLNNFEVFLLGVGGRIWANQKKKTHRPSNLRTKNTLPTSISQTWLCHGRHHAPLRHCDVVTGHFHVILGASRGGCLVPGNITLERCKEYSVLVVTRLLTGFWAEH